MDGFSALVAIFGTSLMVGFSGALMPGPLLTVDISESAKKGFRIGPLLVVGHGIVEALVVLGLTLGLSQVFHNYIASGIIGIVGGAFLIWMGFGMARSAWRSEISLKSGAEVALHSSGPIVSGALVSLSNPYWTLWWATTGAAYVMWALEKDVAGLVSFYSGHILSDLVWYSAVAFVISRGRSLLSDGVYRGLILVCGLFLCFLGVYFIQSGVRAFLDNGI